MKKIVVFSAVALITLAMASCSADGLSSSDINPSAVQNDSIGGPGHTHVPPLPPTKTPGING